DSGNNFVKAVEGVDARGVIASEGPGAARAWCVTAGVGLLRVVVDEQFGAIASRLGTEQGLPTDNAFAVLRAGGGDAGTLLVVTLRDAKGQVVRQKLSRDSQFQAESLAAGAYAVTARAYTLDLVPSETLVLNFEVARAPFPRTIVALSVLLAIAGVALVWALLQHRRVVRSREELRDANHQLAAARLQLASEAEAERRRIARDLHDQTLADLRRLLLLTDEMQQPGTTTPPGSLLTSTTGTTVTDAPRLRAEIES